jgi:Tfp pilus assembly protein PilP
MMRALLISAALLLAAVPLRSQAPAAPKPATVVTTPEKPVPALDPQGYDYKPEGRRDPFISLVRRSSEGLGASVARVRPTGVGGVSVEELAMRGVIKGRNGWSAMIRGADNRTYTVKPGDELYDGTVTTVTADSIVMLQIVNDPLTGAKKREVRKLLRPAQEAR